MFRFVVFLIWTCFALRIHSARLFDPTPRNALWTYSSLLDNGGSVLDCGGIDRQWNLNGGKCGVCGDPWDGLRLHEDGGKYGQGIVGGIYRTGSTVLFTIENPERIGGEIEFKLCDVTEKGQDLHQSCFDEHVLLFADTKKTSHRVKSHEGFLDAHVQLPAGLVCQHCVLQLTFIQDNNECPECVEKRTIRNCADIQITPGKSRQKRQVQGWKNQQPDQTNLGKRVEWLGVQAKKAAAAHATAKKPTVMKDAEIYRTELKKVESIAPKPTPPRHLNGRQQHFYQLQHQRALHRNQNRQFGQQQNSGPSLYRHNSEVLSSRASKSNFKLTQEARPKKPKKNQVEPSPAFINADPKPTQPSQQKPTPTQHSQQQSTPNNQVNHHHHKQHKAANIIQNNARPTNQPVHMYPNKQHQQHQNQPMYNNNQQRHQNQFNHRNQNFARQQRYQQSRNFNNQWNMHRWNQNNNKFQQSQHQRNSLSQSRQQPTKPSPSMDAVGGAFSSQFDKPSGGLSSMPSENPNKQPFNDMVAKTHTGGFLSSQDSLIPRSSNPNSFHNGRRPISPPSSGLYPTNDVVPSVSAGKPPLSNFKGDTPISIDRPAKGMNSDTKFVRNIIQPAGFKEIPHLDFVHAPEVQRQRIGPKSNQKHVPSTTVSPKDAQWMAQSNYMPKPQQTWNNNVPNQQSWQKPASEGGAQPVETQQSFVLNKRPMQSNSASKSIKQPIRTPTEVPIKVQPNPQWFNPQPRQPQQANIQRINSQQGWLNNAQVSPTQSSIRRQDQPQNQQWNNKPPQAANSQPQRSLEKAPNQNMNLNNQMQNIPPMPTQTSNNQAMNQKTRKNQINPLQQQQPRNKFQEKQPSIQQNPPQQWQQQQNMNGPPAQGIQKTQMIHTRVQQQLPSEMPPQQQQWMNRNWQAQGNQQSNPYPSSAPMTSNQAGNPPYRVRKNKKPFSLNADPQAMRWSPKVARQFFGGLTVYDPNGSPSSNKPKASPPSPPQRPISTPAPAIAPSQPVSSQIVKKWNSVQAPAAPVVPNQIQQSAVQSVPSQINRSVNPPNYAQQQQPQPTQNIAPPGLGQQPNQPQNAIPPSYIPQQQQQLQIQNASPSQQLQQTQQNQNTVPQMQNAPSPPQVQQTPQIQNNVPQIQSAAQGQTQNKPTKIMTNKLIAGSNIKGINSPLFVLQTKADLNKHLDKMETPSSTKSTDQMLNIGEYDTGFKGNKNPLYVVGAPLKVHDPSPEPSPQIEIIPNQSSRVIPTQNNVPKNQQPQQLAIQGQQNMQTPTTQNQSPQQGVVLGQQPQQVILGQQNPISTPSPTVVQTTEAPRQFNPFAGSPRPVPNNKELMGQRHLPLSGQQNSSPFRGFNSALGRGGPNVPTPTTPNPATTPQYRQGSLGALGRGMTQSNLQGAILAAETTTTTTRSPPVISARQQYFSAQRKGMFRPTFARKLPQRYPQYPQRNNQQSFQSRMVQNNQQPVILQPQVRGRPENTTESPQMQPQFAQNNMNRMTNSRFSRNMQIPYPNRPRSSTISQQNPRPKQFPQRPLSNPQTSGSQLSSWKNPSPMQNPQFVRRQQSSLSQRFNQKGNLNLIGVTPGPTSNQGNVKEARVLVNQNVPSPTPPQMKQPNPVSNPRSKNMLESNTAKSGPKPQRGPQQPQAREPQSPLQSVPKPIVREPQPIKGQYQPQMIKKPSLSRKAFETGSSKSNAFSSFLMNGGHKTVVAAANAIEKPQQGLKNSVKRAEYVAPVDAISPAKESNTVYSNPLHYHNQRRGFGIVSGGLSASRLDPNSVKRAQQRLRPSESPKLSHLGKILGKEQPAQRLGSYQNVLRQAGVTPDIKNSEVLWSVRTTPAESKIIYQDAIQNQAIAEKGPAIPGYYRRDLVVEKQPQSVVPEVKSTNIKTQQSMMSGGPLPMEMEKSRNSVRNNAHPQVKPKAVNYPQIPGSQNVPAVPGIPREAPAKMAVVDPPVQRKQIKKQNPQQQEHHQQQQQQQQQMLLEKQQQGAEQKTTPQPKVNFRQAQRYQPEQFFRFRSSPFGIPQIRQAAQKPTSGSVVQYNRTP
ncbi:nuclear receptor coactivator 6-like [Saccostrea cucullata]|uniref:nuclear receptor coactivator 6-like n=1 Tax=Saccostrea cuccullata TaxID=36930 RepID=UPI002ED2C904